LKHGVHLNNISNFRPASQRTQCVCFTKTSD